MNDVISMIKSAGSIAILAHDSEDADAAGSSFAMRQALLDMGKKAECFFSDSLEKHLEFMGNSFVVFDGMTEHVDLCMCLDCGDIDRLGKRKAIFDAAGHTVNIDHHETNTFFAEANYVDPDAPATGEIIYELFLKMGIEITKEIAENLYTAISADTGSFKYSSVRPRTMEIAAELLKKKIDHAAIARRLFDTEPMDILKFKGHIMSNIEQYAGGRLTVASVTKEILSSFNVQEKDTGDIVNIARAAEGCEIAVSVRETPEKIKISFRSNGKYSVSGIAEKFGGGGHRMAAGASQKNKSFDEVKAEVIKVCEDVLNG